MKRVATAGACATAALQVVEGKVFFQDTFTSLDGWVQSTWKTDTEMGKFELKAGEYSVDAEDKGLATTEDSRFYGLSKAFDESFSNKDMDQVVLQYQVKYDKDLECGGGYMKIGPKQDDLKAFGDPTPYNIMFGPDKCGYTERTHLIFNYKGKNVLKKTDLPYKQGALKESTLYRLTISKDNTVKVDVNQEEIYSGSLETDWDLLEPKEILDEDDKKPEDWPAEYIADPEAKKPEDYVEAEEIADPEAKQPEDWDAEEDGEWEAPKIKNPHGYPWEAPKILNKDYKEWEQKKIANPKYEADAQLYAYEDFGFAGFDLWQVKSGAIFDNLIITDDLAEADKFAEKWKTLHEHELAKKKEQEEKDREERESKEKEEKEKKEEKDDDDEDDDELDKDDSVSDKKSDDKKTPDVEPDEDL